jgi:ABC-type glycerol-3-phosphate transport system substrate-binding protein
MSRLKRRTLLQASVATAAATLAAPQIKAQSKPEKLVYVGDNGPWHYSMVEEVAPAFEKQTGIKIDFTLLPVDPWRARLRAELGAGSSGIDIAQFSVSMTGWMSPHMENHEVLLPQIKAKHAEFDWDDYLAGPKKAATYDGKLCGLPYRITTGIFHYQKELLEKAGFAKPPENWEQFLKIAQAVNSPPDRYAYGLMGMQGAGMYPSFVSWLYSNGGRMIDFKTGEIFINDAKAVEALQFYGDLITKYKLVPPDAMTWQFEEIVAGGQRDRYAMVQMFAPYGTLISDPKISKTGGKWAWTTVPGPHSADEGRTWIDGHTIGVPRYSNNKEWALEFVAMCCARDWQKKAMFRGNAPPLRSVLEDPEMVEKIGWPPVGAKALETGVPTPGHPVWDTLEVQMRSAISQVQLGQKTAKVALDELATDWQRSLRRAGIGRG